MSAASKRHGVLGGALLLALAVWGVDALLRDGTPKTAAAAGAVEADSATPEIGWRDVSPWVRHAQRTVYTPLDEAFETTPRELFAPPAEWQTVAVDEAERAAAAAEASEAQDREDFGQTHRLMGVMLGSQPRAIINDRLLPLNSDVDGYRLVTIQRDFVVFKHPASGETVRLQLREGPQKNASED